MRSRQRPGEAGQHVFLARSSRCARDLAAVLVQDESGRGAQNADPPHQLQVMLGVDLDVNDTRHRSGDVGEDPAGGAAGSAEGRRELQERRLLAEIVVESGCVEDVGALRWGVRWCGRWNGLWSVMVGDCRVTWVVRVVRMARDGGKAHLMRAPEPAVPCGAVAAERCRQGERSHEYPDAFTHTWLNHPRTAVIPWQPTQRARPPCRPKSERGPREDP